jgi:Predicted transmembrane transcriptional regulator (anti-sigma factor)
MNPVTCVSGVELLMDYLEGVLALDVRAALDEHVAGCERCAAFVASYCATPRILREATASTLPADIEASLRQFLRTRTTAFKRR